LAEPQIVIENREELHFLLSETLDEGDILEVTGIPPASPLENRKVLVRDLRPGQEGSKDFAKRAQVA
jgi:hypothetical protein